MCARLAYHHYGKSQVRVTKVTRLPDRHVHKELTVNVELNGDFDETYLTGDNRKVVATDTIRNTIYVLAKKHPIDSIESFGIILVNHFCDNYRQVRDATCKIEERRWERIVVSGKPHPHAFVAAGPETRNCCVTRLETVDIQVESAIAALEVLKTTDSAFVDFVRDEFTTLADAPDRIFATKIEALWHYSGSDHDWNAVYASIRQALLETFAAHNSLSVQQTLYAMGQAALAACADIHSISLTLPNQHRIPFNLAPFGLENNNDIFVTTSEPYGEIHALITRE